ncbi:MAG: HDOD domain-containing protein, partial [Anaerolineales bacterium]
MLKLESLLTLKLTTIHYRVLEAVAAAGSYRLLSGRLPGYGYDAEDLWRHSVAVACSCKVIARKKDPGLSDTAYLAGLIHDVGKLILDRFVSEKKAEIDSFLQGENRTLLDAEVHFFNFSHASVAAEICSAWNFPDVISNAIRFHHNPSGSEKDFLSYLLHLADYLAISFGLGYESDDHLYELEEGTLEFLGVNRSDFSDIVSRISESLQAVSSSFSQ